MQELYREMENADVIVFASPIYWSGVAGPMKNVVDRMRPYYQNKKLKGKKTWIISIGASADSESDLIEAMYERVSYALGRIHAENDTDHRFR
jgi:multimeric flavodoxin WrbA